MTTAQVTWLLVMGIFGGAMLLIGAYSWWMGRHAR